MSHYSSVHLSPSLQAVQTLHSYLHAHCEELRGTLPASQGWSALMGCWRQIVKLPLISDSGRTDWSFKGCLLYGAYASCCHAAALLAAYHGAEESTISHEPHEKEGTL